MSCTLCNIKSVMLSNCRFEKHLRDFDDIKFNVSYIMQRIMAEYFRTLIFFPPSIFLFPFPTLGKVVFRKTNLLGEQVQGAQREKGRVRGDWYRPQGYRFFQTDSGQKGKGHSSWIWVLSSWQLARKCRDPGEWLCGDSMHMGLQVALNKDLLPCVWHSLSRESLDPQASGNREQ